MMKYQLYFKLTSIVVTLSSSNICRAVNSYLGVLAEVATCISARWTSVVNDNFQSNFWTFINPIWLLMINLPKIGLQIVPDQIAIYLVTDCSSRYLIGVRKPFLLKNEDSI